MFQTRISEYNLRYQFWCNIFEKILFIKNLEDKRLLDIGCATGDFKNFIQNKFDFKKSNVIGIEPQKKYESVKKQIYQGYCHNIPFRDNSFDYGLLISVFEHIPLELRIKSINEIYRVLKKGGKLFIQMPNPKFPIEFHTRLPLVGFFPQNIQKIYVKVFKKRGLGFYSIKLDKSIKIAEKIGFKIKIKKKYSYPLEILPSSLRKFHFLTKIFHMGQYALLEK